VSTASLSWLILVAQFVVACSASENVANAPVPEAGAATGDGGNDAGEGNPFFVKQIDAWIGGGSPDTCILDFGPGAPTLLYGVLDVAFRKTYDASLVVGYRQASSDASSVHVALEQVVVRLEDMTGQVVSGPNETMVAGVVDGAPGATGYGGVEAPLIGPAFGSQIARDLGSSMGAQTPLQSVIRVRGRTPDGVLLESDDWKFPIKACYGCLVVYPFDAVDPTLPRQPNCGHASDPGTIARGCRVGQDDNIDCRVCKEIDAANPICEPPPR
jgi:hypothetical protein